MVAADGTVRRIPGGFWISGDIPLDARGSPSHAPGQPLSEVWSDVQTIRAMERRGWVERTNAFVEEFRDTRRITDAGRAVLSPS